MVSTSAAAGTGTADTRVGLLKRRYLALSVALVGIAACSPSSDEAQITAPTTTTIPGPTTEECLDLTDQAIQPLRDFIAEYEDLTVEEWNSIDPPPDIESAQDGIVEELQEAANEGCDPDLLQDALADAIAGLEGEGEVGEAIAAALRGEGPLQGPPGPVPVTTIPRDTIATTVMVEPEDDLAAIMNQVSEGSTLEFAAKIYNYDEPIVVANDVKFVGAGSDKTFIRSTAEGFVIGFIGPGGFDLRDMTVEHIGAAEASVFLAIEGPVTIADAVIKGGAAGDGEAGGGHGVVFAFEELEGFPERTDAERAGALVVRNSTISGNDAAGILSTGEAAPHIDTSAITGNGGCGICYSGSAAGTVSDSTIEANQIAAQISGSASPTFEDNQIVRNLGIGVSIDGDAAPTIEQNVLEDNAQIGIQVAGTASPIIEGNSLTIHGVGILATDQSTPTINTNVIATQDIGIQVGSEAVVEVTDNQVWVSAVAAISFGETSSGTITGNEIVAADVAGIQVTGEAVADIVHNTVEGEGEVGISFLDSARGSVLENEISEREVGIQIGGGAAPSIDGNTVRNSRAIGILYGDEAGGSATGNTVTGAESAGIILSGTSSPEVRFNTVTDNGVGLVVRENASGFVTNNTILRHVIGVQIVDASSPVVVDNTVKESLEAGVVFGGTTTADFISNVIAENGSIAVQVGESARPEIRGNEILGQGIYGLLYRDDGGGIAIHNEIADHVFGIQLGDTAAPILDGNALTEIALTSIVYADSTGGTAMNNSCPTVGLTAGISVTPPADPVLTDNGCSVSRTG